MRIRIFADIEIPEYDDIENRPSGDPKRWGWHRILNLGRDETITVFEAKEQTLLTKETT